MKKELIDNIKGDIEWLRDNHIPAMPLNYFHGSALIYGNMDAPYRVDLYDTRKPTVYQSPAVYLADTRGTLKRVRGIRYQAYRLIWSATNPEFYRHYGPVKFKTSTRNAWRIDYGVTSPEISGAFSLQFSFHVTRAKAINKAWIAKRTARVTLAITLLNKVFKESA